MENENPNFKDILQTAQKMQQEVGRIQEELARKQVEGAAGGGMVLVVANGRQQIVSISIEPDVIEKEDREMLQDLVVAAVNQALNQSMTLAQEEMAKITGGAPFHIPGLT